MSKRETQGKTSGSRLPLPDRQSFTWICLPGVLLRAHGDGWWNKEVALERYVVVSPNLKTVLNKGKKKIRLNSPCYCCKHGFTTSFVETRLCFLLDVNKSESHKYLPAADRCRFDLAMQGLFFKTQFKCICMYDNDTHAQTPRIEKN